MALGCEPPAPSETYEPAPDTEADKAAIGEAAAAFSAAFMRGDVDAMMALYTEDAVIFPGGSDRLQGQEALRQYWTVPPNRTITLHQITSEQVVIEGDMASDHGVYEVHVEQDGEAQDPAYGKYLIVWHRQPNGAWKMHLDMWNSRPAPEAD
jgi:uncharacterized protein (TIGR02246 family)